MILQYKGIDIFYSDKGSGDAILLLHGFLEDHSMWDDLSDVLTENHRVIAVDLLGHGKSGCTGDVHTMEAMAHSVNHVLGRLQLTEVTLIGHSMGGYVALALSKIQKISVKGLCLLNSTFEADDDERKALRARANIMVKDNFDSMVRMSFANLFSETSKTRYKTEFEVALKIALKTSVQGYIAGQEGMRLRENYTSFFIDASFNKALLLGKKDAVLDTDFLFTWAQTNNIPVEVFEEGHMSHIENKTECINAIVYFIENM